MTNATECAVLEEFASLGISLIKRQHKKEIGIIAFSFFRLQWLVKIQQKAKHKVYRFSVTDGSTKLFQPKLHARSFWSS